MTIESTPALLDSLQRLHLLEMGQLAELTAQVGAGGSDPRALARDLVRRGWLTPFQVNQLFLGRGRDLLLGNYVLLEKLGEGGMGTVFKARHWKLGHVVALKVIRKENAGREVTIRRFNREIRAAAQLDHVHIVKAFDADEVEGTYLLVMEFVDGIDLGKVVRERGPLPSTVAVEFIRQAAIGLEYAWERGLVHRDIKPGNLILAGRGGLLPSGTPPSADAVAGERGVIKILDLGLARLGDGEGDADTSILTKEGLVMGSLDFMAPEQARDSHGVDFRADLYSLGCTFYYLLTGRAPFPAGTPYEKMYRHQFEEPTPLAQLRPDLSPELDAVVRRMMAKRPDDRFQSPGELIDALSTLTLAPSSTPSQPTTIQPREQALLDTANSATAPFAAMSDRNPVPPPRLPRSRLLLAVGSGVLVVGLITWLLSRPGKEPVRDHGEGEVKKTDGSTVKKPPPTDGFVPLFNGKDLDGWEVRSGKPGSWAVQKGILKAFPLTPGERSWLVSRKEYGDFILRLRWLLPAKGTSGVLVRGQAGGGVQGTRVQLTDDLSQGNPQQQTGSVSGRGLSALGHFAGVDRWNEMEITCHGDRIQVKLNGRVVTHGDLRADLGWTFPRQGPIALEMHTGSVEFREVAIKELTGLAPTDPCETEPNLYLRGHTKAVQGVVFTPDLRTLYSTSRAERTLVWNLPNGGFKGPLAEFPAPCVEALLSPDESLIAFASSQRTLVIWPLRGGAMTEFRAPEGEAAPFVSLAWSPDNQTLAAGTTTGEVLLWNWEANELKRRWKAHPSHTVLVAFSPDGKLLLTGGHEATARVWDVQTAEEKAQLAGHKRWVTEGGWSPDGKFLVTGHAGPQLSELRYWDPVTFEPGGAFGRQGKQGAGLAFSPDSRLLACVEGEQVSLILPKEGTVVARLGGLKERCFSVHFSPDGRRVAAAAKDGVYLWDVSLYSVPPIQVGGSFPLADVPEGLRNLAMFPDGNTLAAIHRDGGLHLFDILTRRLKEWVDAHPANGSGLAVSPDGQTVATSAENGEIKLWPMPEMKNPKLLRLPPESWAVRLTFAHDGKGLLAVCHDGAVRRWDLSRGEEATVLGKLKKPGHSVAVSLEGGHWAASDGMDGTVLLDGQPLAIPKLPTGGGPVRGFVAFSPDGNLLAAPVTRSHVVLWDTATREVRNILYSPEVLTGFGLFSPDGRVLVTGGQGRGAPVLLWDPLTGRRVARLRGLPTSLPPEWSDGALFTPNGRLLFTLANRTLKGWDVGLFSGPPKAKP